MIIILEKENLTEKELSQIFTLLKHPLRRSILKQLSEGPQTYSLILKNLSIQESSILNYHLREMGDLLIYKNDDGSYDLNETGKICLTLVLKVKENDEIPRSDKVQLVLTRLRRAAGGSHIWISALVLILLSELCWLGFINFSSFLTVFSIGMINSITISAGSIYSLNLQAEKNQFNKLKRNEKLGIISFLFSFMILVQTIVELLL
ncbi:MAG: DUF7347 domain-containing protein [Promethearchaeota archaeon]